MTHRKLSLVSTLLMLTVSNTVFAGGFGSGTITFVANSVPRLPTLSGWVMVLMAVMLAVVAFRVLRANGSSMNKVASIAVLAGALAIGGYGVDVGNAGVATSVSVTGNACTAGGTAQFDLSNDPDQSFTNQCPNSLRITDVSGSCDEGDFIISVCDTGLVVGPGGSCTLAFCGENE